MGSFGVMLKEGFPRLSSERGHYKLVNIGITAARLSAYTFWCLIRNKWFRTEGARQ